MNGEIIINIAYSIVKEVKEYYIFREKMIENIHKEESFDYKKDDARLECYRKLFKNHSNVKEF